MFPRIRFFGKILHVHVPERVESSLAYFTDESFVGFDMEWKPGNNPVSLVQLASKNTVALFYIQKLGGMPEQLAAFLENPNIIKVGCGMDDDTRRLKDEFGISVVPDCWIDIQSLAQRVDGMPYLGLKSLCEVYLGAYLDKSLSASDWSSRFLSPNQVLYAATDAWVVRHILWSAFIKPTMNGLKHNWFGCLPQPLAMKIIKIIFETSSPSYIQYVPIYYSDINNNINYSLFASWSSSRTWTKEEPGISTGQGSAIVLTRVPGQREPKKKALVKHNPVKIKGPSVAIFLVSTNSCLRGAQ